VWVVPPWWDRLTSGYWFVPLVCVVVAVGAAVGLIALDRAVQREGPAWTYAGGPEASSVTLTTIASSMITLTALVFSITIVALQLTSSQFSPRALRNFLRDRVSQFALGTFVATFAYALAALTAVRFAPTDDAESFVPSITVTGAYVLVAVSVVLFVHFIHHTSQSLRAVSIVERIADETRAAIERNFPMEDGPSVVALVAAGPAVEVGAPRAGAITGVDLDGLARAVAATGARVEVLHRVGSFVCAGAPLLRVYGADRDADDDQALDRFVRLAPERTMRQDAGFGLRQLVDIAERALSPSVNDPTTAVQCLQRIHDLLRMLAVRPTPPIRVGHADGALHAWMPSPTYGELVRLGLEEIRHWGRDSHQIREALGLVVDDLLGVAREPDRRAALIEFGVPAASSATAR
jgi:uncharacterized membrane protein